MRPGATLNGSAMRATIGARTVCDASALLMSRSDNGRTSQNVSVKSKGVCATAQKFAYSLGARCASSESSGTIVKLICLVSAMPVFSHDADDHALHLHKRRIEQDRLHRRVGRLQADAAVLAIELLERHVGAADERNHHLAVVGGLAVFDDDEVAVADLLVDHRVALDAQDVGVFAADEVVGHRDG